MLLTAILLVFSAPQSVNTVKAAIDAPALVSDNSAANPLLSHPLPSAPEAKIAADEVNVVPVVAASNVTPAPAGIEPSYTLPTPRSITPAKAFLSRPYKTSRQRTLWYALSFTGAGAASLDAWSTRRAISRGYGIEGNPMLRPFSHSGAPYAATQVSPLVLEFVGKRMMVSQHPLLRKVWWLPQAVGSGVSFGAAIHNIRMVP